MFPARARERPDGERSLELKSPLTSVGCQGSLFYALSYLGHESYEETKVVQCGESIE